MTDTVRYHLQTKLIEQEEGRVKAYELLHHAALTSFLELWQLELDHNSAIGLKTNSVSSQFFSIVTHDVLDEVDTQKGYHMTTMKVKGQRADFYVKDKNNSPTIFVKTVYLDAETASPYSFSTGYSGAAHCLAYLCTWLVNHLDFHFAVLIVEKILRSNYFNPEKLDEVPILAKARDYIVKQHSHLIRD